MQEFKVYADFGRSAMETRRSFLESHAVHLGDVGDYCLLFEGGVHGPHVGLAYANGLIVDS